jgi:hypothetical protein
MHIGDVGCVEIVPGNEGVVDNHRMVAPTGMPSPTSPSAPTAAEIKSHRYTDTEAEETAAD